MVMVKEDAYRKADRQWIRLRREAEMLSHTSEKINQGINVMSDPLFFKTG